MDEVIKYPPKMVHCNFTGIKDVLGRPQPQIQVLRSILDPVTKDSVCYTIRNKLINNNKSAVGECIYQLKINTRYYNIDTLHLICEDAHNWFAGELNKILGLPLMRDPYNREEMQKDLTEIFNEPF